MDSTPGWTKDHWAHVWSSVPSTLQADAKESTPYDFEPGGAAVPAVAPAVVAPVVRARAAHALCGPSLPDAAFRSIRALSSLAHALC